MLFKSFRTKVRRRHTHSTYETDQDLSGVLAEILKLPGLMYRDDTNYRGVIFTPEGLEVSFWRENKYYAYASDGRVTMNGQTLHHWNGTMPTHEIIEQLIDLEEIGSMTSESAEKQKLRALTETLRGVTNVR